MDYAEQDEADLRELIELFRDGADTQDCLRRISERWAEEGRLGDAEAEESPPSMRKMMDLVQGLMTDS